MRAYVASPPSTTIVDTDRGELVLIRNCYDQKDALKEAGCRWDAVRKAWTVPAVDRNVLKRVKHILGQVPGATTAALDEALSDTITHSVPTSINENAPLSPVALDLKRRCGMPLFDYQARGAAWAKDREVSLIADDMGLGKTAQALAASIDDARILILAPAVVKTHWKREAIRALNLTEDDVIVLKGTTPSPIPPGTRVVVINYDIAHAWVNTLTHGPWVYTSVILDEVHMLKTPTSRRTLAVKNIITARKTRVIALSGTPILNRPVELWPFLDMTGLSRYFGGTWRRYVERYCAAHRIKIRGREVWDYSGASNLGELRQLLYKHCMIRREKKDVLKDLPPRQTHYIELDLEGALRAYAKAERELANDLKKGKKEALKKSKAEAEAALQTLENNGDAVIPTLCRLAGEAKVDAALAWIVEHLESTGRKLVVFTHHTSVRHALLEKIADLGYGVVTIGGESSDTQRAAAVDSFQTDPKVRVFLGQTAAAGVGITLTAASDVVFVELEWVPAQVEQAADRVNRIGQTADSITCTFLVAQDCGVDEAMMSVLRDKRSVINAVMGTEEDKGARRSSQKPSRAFLRSLMR